MPSRLRPLLRILPTMLCILAAAWGGGEAAAQSTSTPPTAADRRVALVVGVSGYRNLDRLPNAGNDARAVAEVLARAGFELVRDGPLIDPARSALEQAIDTFGRLVDPQTVALFYYAGHGVQLRERNFLVPSDASWESADAAERAMIAASLLFARLERNGGGRINIVVLDACRNNPLPPEAGADHPGLGTMDAPTATLISYATQPGNVAMDGAGANSPYTEALVQAMRRPELTVLEMFNEAGLEVQRRTRGQQIPWVSLSPLPSRVYLHRAGAAQPAPPAPLPAAHPCGDAPERVRGPIDRLFRAWSTLDFDLYADSWTEDAFQVAGKIQRDRKQILQQRRGLFGRLARVEVGRTDPVVERVDGRLAFVRNKYTMEFTLKTGRRIVETDVQESYVLACGKDGRWRIKENFDYIAR
ncbi:MAG: caspase family protein [Alphaproteobacteria bacterium]|nr:caspase family protein [Alphaproteobacteria bacterium]